MTAKELDHVRDCGNATIWEIRYMGPDFVFMVGVAAKRTAEDTLTMTRVVARSTFDSSYMWEVVSTEAL